MNILYIITKGEIGGAQRSVCTLAKAMHSNGHDVTVVLGTSGYVTDTMTKAGIKTKIIRSLKRTNNPLKNWRFAKDFGAYVSEVKPDVIHFNSSNTLFGLLTIPRQNKPRTVFTFRGLSLIDPNSTTTAWKKWIYTQYFRYFMKKINEPVFVCDANRQWAEGHIVQKGTTIYNAIDPTDMPFLTRKEARKQLGERISKTFSAEEKLVGTIGRLAYPKNQRFLVQALAEPMRKDPTLHLILIGDGPDRAEIAQAIQTYKLQDQVHLTGKIDQGATYLKAFDVFLLPSIYEGLPLSIIECMHAKVPVLASDVGGNAEILPKNSLYTIDDTTTFITQLKELLTEKKAPPLPDKLQLRTMTEAYSKLYGNKKTDE